ncbi:hypothetical protein [Corallococcus sp. CA053C]|uniref:hypothetical protein n=1 Tax=Corallococcus sp. CA053C TaxID=2316732 RepID=UPI0018F67EB1|nr:hypothetical protein [Corallococcus sp. CA053C]
MLLFPMVQTARILQLRDPQGGHLEKFFAHGEQGLDQMAQERHANSHVMTLGVSDLPSGWLFYPEIGFFQFPAPLLQPSPELGLSARGVAVPLTPYLALAAVPKGADLAKIEKDRGQLQLWSVGLNDDCRRIAIPAPVLRKHQDEVCEDIVAMRERITLCERFRLSANELAKSQL